MSFSKIEEVLKMPNLIEIQKNSYEWFLKQGLKEVFDDVSGITVSTTILFSILWIISDDKPNTACLNVRSETPPTQPLSGSPHAF